MADIPASVVGLGGVEPPTLRLSGVRSNQLSYRPAGKLKLEKVAQAYGRSHDSRLEE